MVLLFQGDSITDCGRQRDGLPGNGILGNGYVSLIDRALAPPGRYRVVNRGLSGNRVTDLLARWDIDALQLQPDVISILIGVNDTWHGKKGGRGVPVDQYAEVYGELLEWTCRELPDTKLVLCEPFVLPCGHVQSDWREEIDVRRAMVAELALDFGACIVPFQKEFDEALSLHPAEYWSADGVHPTEAGHELLAATWMRHALPQIA